MMHGGSYGGMGGMMGGYGGASGGYGGASEVLLWVVIIAVIAWLAYYFAKGRSKESGKVVEILNARYAKGEISREEYLRMKEELK